MTEPIFEALSQHDERVVVTNVYPQLDGSTLEIVNDGVPTQVANPGRTTRRALVQLAVALFTALPIIIPVILDAWSPEWLAAALLQVLAVHTVATRIMAIPGVNAWIVQHLPVLAAIPVESVKQLPPA